MAGFSAAGTVESWDAKSPKWVDLMPGNAYTLTVANPTDSDVTSGTITFEAADADPEDMCKPGTFSTFQVDADCAQPIGETPRPAVITITAQTPIGAHRQCNFSFPCPKRFVRVTGAPAALDVHVVITRLKRTGMAAVDPSSWPFGYAPYMAPLPPEHAEAARGPARGRRVTVEE